jgi:hypothetical protein
MTKEEKSRYSEPEALRDILKRVLAGRKFMLDCGHYVSFGHFLGNDITIIVRPECLWRRRENQIILFARWYLMLAGLFVEGGHYVRSRRRF